MIDLSFSPEQANFLNNGLGLNIESDRKYSFNKPILKKIIDYCMDIEEIEALSIENDNDEISSKGKTAADLYDLICNNAMNLN